VFRLPVHPLYLPGGRLWLLWLICGLRALMLVLNFVPGPISIFAEITSLQPMPLLGELISRPHGMLHPLGILMPLSFSIDHPLPIDVAHTAASRSGERVLGAGRLLAVGFSAGARVLRIVCTGNFAKTFSSQLFLSLIL